MKKWRLIEPTSPDLLTHLCRIRQINESELEPDYKIHLHDPMLLPDMDKAVALFEIAAQQKWPIVVFGDYDADGTIATAILSLTLEKLGLPHSNILPKRPEGYGFGVEALEKLPAGTKLLITVDNGIAAVEAITLAKKRGIATIILDHHLPGAKLPPAEALVDPYLSNSRYPFPNLCGASLAYKFVVALSGSFPVISEAYQKWLLDLAAVATVADVMPLIGENRALVHFGLLVLRHNRRAGLRELLAAAAVAPSHLSGYNLGFIIGPRFNASGRMGDNRPALELLLAKEPATLKKLAEEIERSNSERLHLLEKAVEEAKEAIADQLKESQHLLAAYSSKWPVGLVGLIAGRLAGRYARPVIIGHKKEEKITASARSTPHFHLVDNITKASDRLLSYGGHRQAAGLSLLEKNWLATIKQLQLQAHQQIKPDELVETLLIEADLSDQPVSWALANQIDRLSPFGYGNPSPVFILRDWRVGRSKRIGNRQQHLSLDLEKKGQTVKAVAFGWPEENNLSRATQFIGQLEKDEWQGRRGVRLKLLDAAGPDKEIKMEKYDEGKGNLFLQ